MLKELMEYELRSFDDFVRDYATLYKSIDKACTELVDIGFYLNDRFFQKTNFPAYGEMILTINEWLVLSLIHI